MRVLNPIVLACYLSGCITWHAQSAPPGDVIADQRPARILVTPDTGAGTKLERPTVRGDSLIGWEPNAKRYVGMPMSQVKTIGVPKHDPVKTLGLTLGVVVAAAYVSLAVRYISACCEMIIE
jgi:hypothetical protein